VYLAGFINGEKIDECTSWRKKIRSFYLSKGWEQLVFLDPLNGDERETIDREGLTSLSIPGKAIVHRDYQSVVNSNLIIANLDTFGATRPLTGTIYELAWAWMKEIPVILITNNHIYTKHPFIVDTASVIVSSVEPSPQLTLKLKVPPVIKGRVKVSSLPLV
jgi:nucleoside 2-deoxyribosyltransferase